MIVKFADKESDLKVAMDALAAINREHLEARDANDARVHEMNMAFLAALTPSLNGQHRAAEHFAAPIGPSVEYAQIFPALASPVTVDIPDAEAIRESAKLIWGDLEQISLKTDGFRFHTSGLSVENPESDGYLMARVRDPRFNEAENPYTDAAQRRSEIVVLGRRGYKDALLAGLEIVDFIRENPSPGA